jgi:hypothetical protein
MREYLNILEASQDNGLISDFTGGYCYALALTLHDVYDWPLAVIAAEEEENEDIFTIHAFVTLPNGMAFDIEGPKTIGAMINGYAGGETGWRAVEMSRVEFLRQMNPELRSMTLAAHSYAMKAINDYLKPSYPNVFGPTLDEEHEVEMYAIIDEDFDGETDVHHGTSREFNLPFRPNTHFGSLAQAKFYWHNQLYQCVLRGRFKREEDPLLHKWPQETLDQAKAEGYDGIVYLNRWEGISSDEKTAPDGGSYSVNEFMLYTDEEFKQLCPSAHDSYIVFDPQQSVEVKQLHGPRR